MSILKRPKIGLALGSGGAKGLVHIGIIKELVKNDIPIDYIAGSSMGALVGGAYAATKDIKKIEEVVSNFGYRDLFNALSDPTLSSGFIKGVKVMKYLEGYFGDVKIEDCEIPFCAVATDAISGKSVTICKGKLVEAIRASSSAPPFLKPYRMKNRLMVDGGASQPVPVKTVKNMGAKKIIAINLYDNFFPTKRKVNKNNWRSSIEVLRTTLELLVYHFSKECIKEADVVISPDVPNVRITEVLNGQKLIKIGERAVRRQLREIKKL